VFSGNVVLSESHEVMNNCKKCEHDCHCSDGGSCTSCECKDCDCQEINATQDEELKPQYNNANL